MSDFGSKLLAGKWQFWAQFPTLRRSWRLLCAGSPTVSRRAVRQSRMWRQRRQRRQQRPRVNRRHRLCSSSSLAPVQTKLVKVIRRRASLQSNFTLLLVKSQLQTENRATLSPSILGERKCVMMRQLSQLCRNHDIKGYKDITFHSEITLMYFLPKTSYFSLVNFSSSPSSVKNCSW